MSNYKNENQIKDYEIIYEILEDYLEHSDKGLNFQKITDGILEISEAKFAVFNLYEEKGKQFTTKAISGENKIINKTVNFLGIEVLEKKWDHDKVRAAKIKKHIITRFTNISQLIGDVLPQRLTNALTKSFDIGEILVAKITKDNVMLGEFILIMSKDKSFKKFEVVEKYCRHIGLLIEKNRSEEKLVKLNKAYNEKSKMLKTITDNMIDQVALTDPMGNFTYVGKSHSVLGYDLDSLIGRNVMELVHPEDIPNIEKRLVEFVEKRLESEKVQYRIRCNDGSYFWWETIGNLIIEDDEVKGIVFSSRNIMEEKKLKENLKLSEERFRKLFNEVSSVAIQGYEPGGKVVFWNKASEYLYGYPEKEALSRNLIDLIIPDNYKSAVKKNIEKMFKRGKAIPSAEEIKMKHKDGTLIPVYSNHVIVKMNNGKSQLFCLDIDLRDQKFAEKQLYIEKELFKTTLLSVGDGVISTSSEGNVVMLNKVAEKLTGWTQKEAYGKPLEKVFNLLDNTNKKNTNNPVKEVLDSGEKFNLTSKNILISKDGSKRPIESSAAPIIDINDNITGAVLVFRDFTEKKKQQDKIRELSFKDHLTNLYNRRYFEIELKRLDTERNLPLTIIMGDVNGLKLINDSFGHKVGDDLLKTAANIIKESCRKDEIIARIGGDEFAIIIPQGNVGDAELIINRIKENSKSQNIKGIEISVSFGYASKSSKNEKIDALIKKAEDMVYKNKLFEGPSIRGRAIDNIVEAINNKSPREKEHSERVSEICVKIGEALKLDNLKIKELQAFGLFHDIGKIAISDNILDKTGPLDPAELDEMRRHPEIGYRILSAASDMSNISEYVLAHHERWDGKGYPKGLKGKEIPLPSRICMIADAYDAMTSERSYRSAMSSEYAVDQLKRYSGTQFDEQLVEIFIQEVQQKI